MTPARVCRKKRILSTPDRTCHQAASWSFLPSSSSLYGVPCHPFIPVASIAACRLTLAAPPNQPGFGDIAINRNTFGTTNRLAFSWESDVQVHCLPKSLQLWIPSQRPNEHLHTKQRVPPSQKRAGVWTTCTTVRIKHQSLP